MVDKKYVAIVVIAIFAIIGIASASLVLSSTSKTPITSNNDMKMNKSDSNTNNNDNVSQATVIIQNGTFNPSKLTVRPGTTVIWVSKDSNTQYMVTGNGFMSPHLSSGESFSYTFDKSGTYDYYDMDHMNNKNLTGTIIVQ